MGDSPILIIVIVVFGVLLTGALADSWIRQVIRQELKAHEQKRSKDGDKSG